MKAKKRQKKQSRKKLPIKHWSHSSLMAYLRNPLAWYKRYVEEIFDTPKGPASFVGSAGHYALEHFYKGVPKELAIERGLEYLRRVSDFEIDFGKAKSKKAKREKRKAMEADYLRAIGYYLAKAPRHNVLGVEVRATVEVEGLPLPIKAISDLVVESKGEPGAVDVVDHKFVAAFSKNAAFKSLFIIQAIFNYYTVRELFGKPVNRFIVYECKKTKNADGSPQLRRYVINYNDARDDFALFHRLINDATEELRERRLFLPNPSDMFEGDHSFDLYRLQLTEEEPEDVRKEV
jgi:PD-(D/E)XK nuclease superfamily